jgi:pyruvate/2-oxoglutarate dehydrogenase complex dihydrolipoamide acyltransferase (E2) component
MDRVILKNSRLAYSGIYSDSEAEEFTKDPEEPKADSSKATPKETKPKTAPKPQPQAATNQVPPTNEIPRASELPVEIKANPRQDLVTYCTAKGLRITEIARTYKLNNGSKDEEFINALNELKKTCGE